MSKPWREAVGVLVAAVLLGAGQAGTAGAVTTVEGDPTNSAYTTEPLRVRTVDGLSSPSPTAVVCHFTVS
ncbi:hypothetical protein [Streptomyces sp. NPDC091371]|uniref:hypothetical protein n=1 Tax=Streptomyces sp. NPDC091371 TaxID=3155303 RepID=UPI00344149AC